jgi:hypothetical protein
MSSIPITALAGLPAGLRDELLAEFRKITRNYREHRWEAAELDGGRLCEVVYSILAGLLDNGNYPLTAFKPPQFDRSCKDLEKFPKTYSDSARISIPRVLVGLYDVRNRRGVGHMGGEVSANEMDASYVLHTSQWIMAELVRMFHSLSVDDATKVVHGLVDRTLPMLWEVNGVTRVLDPSMALGDKTLVRLYADGGAVSIKTLMADLERDDGSNYRRVLDRLHGEKMIEHNKTGRTATISPLGVAEVERRLLPS